MLEGTSAEARLKRRKRFRSLSASAARSLLFGGAAIAAAELARRTFRRTQLFCPDPQPVRTWNPEDYGVPPGRVTEEWFETPDGETLYGWYCRAERPIASALFCHGNTGNLTTVAEIIPHLLDAGYNVLFFDYRGFGRSSGIATIGGVVADGITAARFHDSIRPREIPSVIYGFSLGGAVAAQIIRHHHFDGLILQSTFTSLPEITRVAFPRLPLHLFAGKFFDTLGVLERLRVPVLIIHGTSDEVVPSWMAHRLFDACSAPKRLHVVDGGLHKDLFVRDSDALVFAINQFIAELPLRTADATATEPSHSVEEYLDSALRYVRRHLRRRSPMTPKPL